MQGSECSRGLNVQGVRHTRDLNTPQPFLTNSFKSMQFFARVCTTDLKLVLKCTRFFKIHALASSAHFQKFVKCLLFPSDISTNHNASPFIYSICSGWWKPSVS